MLRITTLSVLSALILSACGSSDSESSSMSPEPSSLIQAPDSVVAGERFTFSLPVGYDLDDVEVSEELYIEAQSDTSWDIVAPARSLNVNEFSISLNTSDGEPEDHTIRVEQPQLIVPSEPARPYPFVSSWLPSASGPSDDNGVPYYRYNGQEDYFPIQISKMAQAAYAKLFREVETQEEYDVFFAMVDWMRDNCVYTDWGFCSWQTAIDVPAYRLPDNWTSAMAQGQAISALISAYSYTGDTSYLDVVMDALPAFNYPIEEKGVRADYDGVPFYEEYGSETDPAHVLNGFLFGIAGVYDAVEILDSELAKQIFEQGVDSLEQRIDRFDAEFTSYYDDSFLGQLASNKSGIGDSYHELHIFQLAWVHQVTGSEKALEYADKFLRQDTRGIDSFGRFKDISVKITDLQVSDEINDRFGKHLLTDSNWTFRRYWASEQNPVTITMTLNGQSVSGPIVLDALRMTTVSESDLPKSINLYSCQENPVLVADNLDPRALSNEPFELVLQDYYRSLSYVIDTNAVELPCNDLVVEMVPSDESGVIRIREINPHFKQDNALSSILDFYDNLFVE